MPEQHGRDPFADFDAAYVFGALSPDDRATYEAHLLTCEACREAVASIAGVPGLLARVPVDQVENAAGGDVPATLLPRLLGAAAAERRRARARTAVAGLLAAACIVAALVVALAAERGGHPPVATGPTSSASTSSSPAVAQLPMDVVGTTDVRATIGLQSVAWGTRIEMRCSYPTDSSEYPGEVTTAYRMRVTSRTGDPSTAASWKAVPGRTIRIEGDSELAAGDIALVEVLDAQGNILLELTL